MNDTEIIIAVTEALGWVCEQEEEYPHRFAWRNEDGTRFCLECDLPDYPNDLNAMRGAWLTLDEECKIQFIRNLFVICGYDACIIGSETTRQISVVTNSTARQRAEAFLRTLGKWKDETK